MLILEFSMTGSTWTWTWCVSGSKSSNWQYRGRKL